ncbi:MAG: helix-turn-helix transcriptional regulator [Chitinispirillia bacterium]
MKEKDVCIEHREHQIKLFVEKDDGSIDMIQTGSYIAKNYIDDFWKKQKHFKKTALKQLINNEISSIAYYIIIREIGIADVAVRIGVSTAQVKKHMKSNYFKNIKLELAQKYADVFGVPVANLFQIPMEDEESLNIIQTETDNPFIVTIGKGNQKK